MGLFFILDEVPYTIEGENIILDLPITRMRLESERRPISTNENRNKRSRTGSLEDNSIIPLENDEELNLLLDIIHEATNEENNTPIPSIPDYQRATVIQNDIQSSILQIQNRQPFRGICKV